MNTKVYAGRDDLPPPTQLHVRLISGVTTHFPARGTEWFTALILLNIGWTLSLEGSTFAGSPRIWAPLAEIASEGTWAAICLTIAVLRIGALFVNGTFSSFAFSPHIRVATSFLACFVWYRLATGMSAAGINSTGAGTYAICGAFELWNIYWAASNAKQADVVRRILKHRDGGDGRADGDADH